MAAGTAAMVVNRQGDSGSEAHGDGNWQDASVALLCIAGCGGATHTNSRTYAGKSG